MANGVENIFWNEPQLDGELAQNWRSEVMQLAQPATRLVPSWQVEGSDSDSLLGPSIETFVQARDVHGRWGRRQSLGRYAFASTTDSEGTIHSLRATRQTENDGHSVVDQDTLKATGLPFDSFRLSCNVKPGQNDERLTVHGLAVAASNHLQVRRNAVYPSMRWTRAAVELEVPQISQYIVNDEAYSQLDGGAGAWCSPTAVTMIMRYFGAGPNGEAHAAVADAAYHTFDAGRQERSTGNWAFNTAYAAHHGLDAQVAAYIDLNDVEERLHRGLPTAISVSWDNTSSDPSRHLEGVSKDKVGGHLVVIRGVTGDGDIIINDPATLEGDDEVRRIVDRGQLENCWLNHGGWGYQLDPRA